MTDVIRRGEKTSLIRGVPHRFAHVDPCFPSHPLPRDRSPSYCLPFLPAIHPVNPEPVSKDFQLLATIVDAMANRGTSNSGCPTRGIRCHPPDPNNLDHRQGQAGPHALPRDGFGDPAREESGMGTAWLCQLPSRHSGLPAGVQQGLGDGGVGFGIRGGRVIDEYQPNEIDRQPMPRRP